MKQRPEVDAQPPTADRHGSEFLGEGRDLARPIVLERDPVETGLLIANAIFAAVYGPRGEGKRGTNHE